MLLLIMLPGYFIMDINKHICYFSIEEKSSLYEFVWSEELSSYVGYFDEDSYYQEFYRDFSQVQFLPLFCNLQIL